MLFFSCLSDFLSRGHQVQFTSQDTPTTFAQKPRLEKCEALAVEYYVSNTGPRCHTSKARQRLNFQQLGRLTRLCLQLENQVT